jgi:hypothetical protein
MDRRPINKIVALGGTASAIRMRPSGAAPLLLATTQRVASRVTGLLQFDKRCFRLSGQPTYLNSGELHYFRVPVQAT